MIYPNIDLEELYLEHQSIWEEVWSGDLDMGKALEYMQVLPNTCLYEKTRSCLIKKIRPL
jgi:hypothetical protein